MLFIGTLLALLSACTALPCPDKLTPSRLTPTGGKAGLSGYIGIQSKPAFKTLAPHISWYSDYTPNTPDSDGVKGIGMIWGTASSSCGKTATDRAATFKRMVKSGKVPDIMFGFYEPDWTCPSSSDMTVAEGASDWEELLAPLAKKGTVLGSPSMAKQYDEDWLEPFAESISAPWNVTAIHINKPTLAEATKVVEYYVKTYNKPVWVQEFACVHDRVNGVADWKPCTNQGDIDKYINDLVKYFEGNKNVVAYGPSNGEGLGEVWPLTKEGKLTNTGRTYLNAIKGL